MKHKKAVAIQLGYCAKEAQDEFARRSHCHKDIAELVLLDILKNMVAEIERKKSAKQFWRWGFYRKNK